MRNLALILAGLLAAPAAAQISYVPSGGGGSASCSASTPCTTTDTNSAASLAATQAAAQRTCAPVTGVLSSAASTVSMSCPGASDYLITVTPVAGQPALMGTITSTDPTTGGNRRLFKTGVGPLAVSAVPLNGSQGSLEFRSVGGGLGQQVGLSSYTSGQATVTIYGMYGTSLVFSNGPSPTTEEDALRLGRAYTASTGVQTVPQNSFLTLLITNAAANNLRMIFTHRLFSCDVPTGNTALRYAGISNPTVNLPTTAANITNRRTGGAASVASVAYGVSTTRIDTNPTTANPIGNLIPTGGAAADLNFERTVEPGTSFSNYIVGYTGGGIGGASASCVITMTWYEEPIY